MKNAQLNLLTLLLYAAGLDAKIYEKNVQTYEIGPGADIKGNTITYSDPDCAKGLSCKRIQECEGPDNSPSLSDDKKYFACCLPGQRLLGSPETAFDCCADGHDLVGNSHCGYHCCPTGFTFDGTLCQESQESCKNGKALVDGKCACPKGTTESPDGTCKKTPGPDPEGGSEPCKDGACSSGLESGKCYIFKADNGFRLGLAAADNVYYAAPESLVQRYGRFQLCLDEKCAPGKPINPSDGIYIRDVNGDFITGANPNQWLAHAQNGGHVGRSPLFSIAGPFSITKWICGKYCLGGLTEGISIACPAALPAMTFNTLDPQKCLEFELLEVPCDLKSNDNNCQWRNCDKCCDKGGCSKSNCSNKENISNSSVRVSTHLLSSPNNPLPDKPAPDNDLPGNSLTSNLLPDNTPQDNELPDNSLAESPSNLKSPFFSNTTLLLATISIALYAIIPKLRQGKLTQIMTKKNKVTQVPGTEESVSPFIAREDRVVKVLDPTEDIFEFPPEQEDLSQFQKETSEVESRYTTGGLSRYTTKSRTVVSTSRINHDETSSSVSFQTGFESSDSTPEELDLEA